MSSTNQASLIRVYEPDPSRDFLFQSIKKPPFFCCTIASTDTALIPGVSAAGASPELIPFTAAADVEAIIHGRALCLDKIPENPIGPPSPVIITMAALQQLQAPFLIIDAGNQVTPRVPVLVAGRCPGRSLNDDEAVAMTTDLFQQGIIIGRQLAFSGHTLILGESVPGGTTTAMALMEALGLKALGKISGSMPGNNQSLKQELVTKAMARKNIQPGACAKDPFRAVQLLGDPMQLVQAGIAMSASRHTMVILGGGTQMIAVAALIGSLLKYCSINSDPLQGLDAVCLTETFGAKPENIAIATTSWVTEDSTADLRGLIRQLPIEMPLYAANLNFASSRYHNLQMYEKGYVKEGVGAGAMALAAMYYGNYDNLTLLPAIEKIYESIYLQM
ncbi:MAG TPA: TIGR00303 family protein [Proteobacteria bacterium]|nr:TIGR00303 family protein [Pseudomonadota bacterium]